MEPTFDKTGCITAETEEAIARWGWGDQRKCFELFAFAEECFDKTMGRWDCTADRLEIATGGWSNNECVVGAMLQNPVFRGLYWDSSHRGGLTIWRAKFTGESDGELRLADWEEE